MRMRMLTIFEAMGYPGLGLQRSADSYTKALGQGAAKTGAWKKALSMLTAMRQSPSLAPSVTKEHWTSVMTACRNKLLRANLSHT